MNKTLLKNTFFAFILLFFSIYSSAQTFVGPGTDWNTASNWSGSSVPSNSISGTITINSNVNVATITIKNGGELIVNSPAILTVGTIGNSAAAQVVDFQNGSKVTVNMGASMIVYGLLNNSNNSDNVKFNGQVSVDGNITAGNGSTVIGSGSLSSTGTVTGAGTVFGTTIGCTSGNGCNYGCSANAISADQTICSGGTVALTGNTDTGYSYQWQSSTTSSSIGFSNISGATSDNYASSTLTTTTYFRRIVSVASGCSSSNSNVIKVIVNPSFLASVSIAASLSGTICAGTSITFTATPTNGGTTPVYQWRLNRANVGTNSPAYTNAALTNGVVVTCVMTSNAALCLTGSPATSNAITMSVNSTPTLTGASQAAAVCAGLGAVINLAGLLVNSTSTISYSINGVAQNAITGVVANGSGAASFTSAALTAANNSQQLQIRGVTTTSTTPNCSATFTRNVTMLVNPATVGGTVTGGTTICSGSSSGLLTLAGNTGTITKWQSSVSPFSTWTDISNTATTYTSGALTATTQFRAVVQSGSCATENSVTTTVTVSPTSVGGTISGGITPICQGSTTGTLTLSGQVGTVVQWERKLDSGAWGNIGYGGSTTFSEIPYAAGTWQYRVLVQRGSCASAYSLIQTIVVSPTPVGGNVDYATTPICINTATSLNLSGITGTVVRWEKRVNSGSWTIIANTTTTLSETPSSSGNWEYRALVNSGSCAAVYSASRSVVVNPALTITLESSNITVCQGINNPLISYISTTGNPQGYLLDFVATANAAGIQDQNGDLNTAPNSITINYIPSNIPIGVYNGNLTIITYYPSCSSVVYPVSITVTAPPVVPSLGTPTQPNCKTPTGTVSVTSPSPAAGITYTVTGTNPVVAAVTNKTGVFSGLAAGNYNVTTANGSCTSSPVAVVINTFVLVTNTWNGSAWDKSSPPTGEQKLVFADNYPPAVDPNVDIEGCSCKITGSKTVKIKSGRTLTITNEVAVEGTGSLIFENNASLVQINNTTINSGDIEYQRSTSTPVLKTDYVYWSSPVLGLSLGELSAKTVNGTFYSFNAETEDWNQAFGGTIMDIGKGYIVRRPDFISGVPVLTETYTAYFVGEPNNGLITFPIGYTGAAEGTSNLLGNPYPSAIDADKFLTENKNVLDGTLYFWTHNTALNLAGSITNPGPGWAYTYSLDDYASYNITGGVGTAPDITASAPSDPGHPVLPNVVDIGKKPSGKIASGQGFFATSKAAGDVKFTNEMRVAGTTNLAGTGVNQQFFKTKNPNAKTANVIEKNRVWLNLTNTEGAFKQTLIGYVTDATNDYDNLFDGQSFDANEYVDFYSVYQDKNLVIQGRALPFDTADEVPLGYRTTINGDFTINIDQVDGLLTNQDVFIEDKLTNTTFDLKSGNYTFNTVAGTFNDRFVLKYTNKTLGVDAVEKEDGILVFYSNNYNTLIVHNESMDSTVNSVSLFNVVGQNIGVWDVRDSEQTNIQIPIKKISTGIYIVKANTTKGESSKKIIVNIQ